MTRFDRVIPPGGEGEVAFTLNTSGYQGYLNKSAVIHSNDPKQPQLKVTLTARIKSPITLEPRGVLLYGGMDEDVTGKITLKADEHRSLTLYPFEFSLKDKAAYTLETIIEGKEYAVVFRNLSKKREKYSGTLKFKTNYADKPEISIPVYGYIKGILQLQPEAINFGQIPQTKQMSPKSGNEAGVSYRRSIMITLNQGENFEIEKVEVNDEIFETDIQKIKEGKQYQVDLRLKAENIPKGRLNENMKVFTNMKDDAVIVIPMRAEKM